ncbi:MAG: hypothetical protein GF383_10530 [Candidatus Lokiarchaeota archaeon]|nr:hypothetical protein [Candidatus Lokiarchaeota archaeon]MBD3341008.1 hypothetical protein [Candidatus Lokiarchaeota archaeon]
MKLKTKRSSFLKISKRIIVIFLILSNTFLLSTIALDERPTIYENRLSDNQDDTTISINNDDNQMNIILPNAPPDILYSKSNNYSQWKLTGVGGAPVLPMRPYNILLPPNIESKSIKLEIIGENKVFLNGEYYFPPGPNSIALTKNNTIFSSDDLNYIYNLDSYWPLEFIDTIHTEQIRDAVILKFNYFPYQYNPVNNSVIEHRNVMISISWEDSSSKINNVDPLTKKYLLNLGRDIDNIAEILPFYENENVETLKSSSDLNSSSLDIPDTTYLIVTTNDIESNSQKLDDFIRYKQALGFKVMIITEDEYGSASGEQRVFNIRNWLQNNYITESINYVLLIGDPNPDEVGTSDTYGDIPMLMCYPRHGAGSNEESPTDYFYADLTGDWDSDDDGYYGEFGTGSSPEDSGVDFGAEVYVGRIPVYSSDYTSLDNILQNIIDHHINAGYEKNYALLPMAISNYANENHEGKDRTDGLDCPEDFYNNILNPTGIEDTVMYERSGLNPVPTSAFHFTMPLTKSNFISEFNNGYGIIFWWGHGNDIGAYRKYWASDDGDNVPEADEMESMSFLTSYDMNQLETDQPAFFYQSSCNNGNPDITNNLGYANLQRGSAVSTISASRVSWYLVGNWQYNKWWSTYADNTGIGYYYFENLLNNGMTSGNALYAAKSSGGDNTYSGSWMNKMDFNLYGDPQMDYWGSNQPHIPNNPSPSDGETIGFSPTLNVDVSDPDGDTLNVAFYDASDDSLIGVDLGVLSGDTASVPWLGLPEGVYSWYVVVGDNQVIRQSPVWEFIFTTNNAPNAPNTPSPSDGAVGVGLNPTLSVNVSDPDGDTMTVRFYDASNDELIGVETGIASGSVASVSWSALSGNTVYTWYAEADDGSETTRSLTWQFTTALTNNNNNDQSDDEDADRETTEKIPSYSLYLILGLIGLLSTILIKKREGNLNIFSSS